MPIMTEGAEEAEAVSEAIKAEANKRFRIRQHTFEVGKDELIRLVTDHVTRPLVTGDGTMAAWITMQTHGFIPTKARPDEYTGKWPEKMWAGCLLDRMFRLRDPGDPTKLLDEYEDGYGKCYIHDTYAGVKEGPYQKDRGLPDAQVYSLAVLREPVRSGGDDGPVVGFRDKTAEWTDPKGNVITVPHFVIISQKWSNFYAPIKAACYVEPRTATNKDFLVRRPNQKEYTIVPANQDPSFMHGTPDWGQQYEVPLAAMGFDLRTFLLDHATLDHYKRWFIPGATPEGGYARKEAPAEEDPGAAPAGVTPAGPAIDQGLLDNFKGSLAARSASS